MKITKTQLRKIIKEELVKSQLKNMIKEELGESDEWVNWWLKNEPKLVKQIGQSYEAHLESLEQGRRWSGVRYQQPLMKGFARPAWKAFEKAYPGAYKELEKIGASDNRGAPRVLATAIGIKLKNT